MPTTETIVHRARRKVLTDAMVAKLPRKAKPYFHPDPEMPKHGVRVMPNGPSGFYAITRDPFGRQRWKKVGTAGPAMSIAEARKRARVIIERVERGEEPEEPAPVKRDSVADVCANYLKRHIEKNSVITAPTIKRYIDRYILPHWADKPFEELKRSDATRLLDHIEDNGLGKGKGGAPRSRMADQILGLLISIGRWHEGRSDSYTCPFRAMPRRVDKRRRRREHQLTDDQLRAIWRACEGLGRQGAFFQLALLTAQRRAKVAAMKWSDISDDGIWTIPKTSDREKGTAERLKLPKQAMAILAKLPRFAGDDHVFSRGNVGGWKAALDKASGVTGWRVHDLRRNARALLKRAGVPAEVAEEVLGHEVKVSQVQGVYDVEKNFKAMGEAVQAAADLLARIINGQTADVVLLRAAQ